MIKHLLYWENLSKKRHGGRISKGRSLLKTSVVEDYIKTLYNRKPFLEFSVAGDLQ